MNPDLSPGRVVWCENGLVMRAWVVVLADQSGLADDEIAVWDSRRAVVPVSSLLAAPVRFAG